MNLKQFFNLKEVQKTYRFTVAINDNSFSERFLPNELSNRMGFSPKLEYYNVSNISLPMGYSFKKEIQKYGTFPKSFPVLDHDGFEIAILFEESDRHDIGALVNWLQRKIMSPDGIYYPPDKAKINSIEVNVLDDYENIVATYRFPNAYFLRCQNVIYDYYTSDILRCEVVFNADIENVEIFSKNTQVDNSPFPFGIPNGINSSIA